jgi:hypothetical protein
MNVAMEGPAGHWAAVEESAGFSGKSGGIGDRDVESSANEEPAMIKPTPMIRLTRLKAGGWRREEALEPFAADAVSRPNRVMTIGIATSTLAGYLIARANTWPKRIYPAPSRSQ